MTEKNLDEAIKLITYESKIKAIAKATEVFKRFKSVSNWILAGTIYTIFQLIIDTEKHVKTFGKETLKDSINLFLISLIIGVIYLSFIEAKSTFNEEFKKLLETHPLYIKHKNELGIAEGFEFKYNKLEDKKTLYKTLDNFNTQQLLKHILFLIQLGTFVGAYILLINSMKNFIDLLPI